MPDNTINPEEVFSIDFTGEETSLLPQGVYKLVVKDCNLRKGPAGPYFNVEYNVVENGQHDGRVVYDSLSFSPNSMGRTGAWLNIITGKAFQGAAQITAGQLMQLGKDLIGRTIKASIVHKPDLNDVIRPKVSKYHQTSSTVPSGNAAPSGGFKI